MASSRRELDQRIDAQLRQRWQRLPDQDPNLDLVERRRQVELACRETKSRAVELNIHVQNLAIDRPTEPPVTVRIYRSGIVRPQAAGFMWIHGGGFQTGSPAMDDGFCAQVASAIKGTVVSVDYRLAPEARYPMALNDCWDVLTWMLSEQAGLNFDPTRIGLGGVSSGGNLAAALALRVRDADTIHPAMQFLKYACLDDRPGTAFKSTFTDGRVWNRQQSDNAWRSYVGEAHEVDYYAAPARCEDLSGLPPTYIFAAEIDLVRDENIEYAGRLMQAGVSTELHVAPGTFHGFDRLVPEAAISRRIADEFITVIRAGLTAAAPDADVGQT